MMTRNQMLRTLAIGAVAAVLLAWAAMPAFGADVIRNGVDLWRTPAGYSYLDFSDNPVPAGFFCSYSEPFTGRVVWTGVPLATQPKDSLNGTDTIVQRLDDAVFDDQGVAITRLRVRALSMASVEPIQTECGSFHVAARLDDGEQPTTEMRIIRAREGGGTFTSELELNVRLTFTPVKGGTPLELTQTTYLPGSSLGAWSTEPLRSDDEMDRAFHKAVRGFVTVDTNGDGLTDLTLPGVSNFYASGRAEVEGIGVDSTFGACVPQHDSPTPTFPTPDLIYCHDAGYGNKCHCTYPLVGLPSE
ncbi:MAG: hypothetical protein AAGC60_09415 [Acidobacteriota bacterium]